MTDEDPGFAAIFAPYPSAYLSTAGAVVDSVYNCNTKCPILMHEGLKQVKKIDSWINIIADMCLRHS